MGSLPHLDHLTIYVRSAVSSRDWYVSALRLKVEFEVASPRAVALQDAGGFTLFVEERASEHCVPSCILTFRVHDVAVVAAELIAAGTRLDAAPQKLFWGYGAELRDPDGYLIRIWDEQSMKEKGG